MQIVVKPTAEWMPLGSSFAVRYLKSSTVERHHKWGLMSETGEDLC